MKIEDSLVLLLFFVVGCCLYKIINKKRLIENSKKSYSNCYYYSRGNNNEKTMLFGVDIVNKDGSPSILAFCEDPHKYSDIQWSNTTAPLCDKNSCHNMSGNWEVIIDSNSDYSNIYDSLTGLSMEGGRPGDDLNPCWGSRSRALCGKRINSQ